MLPGIIGAIILIVQEYHQGRAQQERDTTQTIRALAQAVDNQILQVQSLAKGLATADSLARGDFSSFHSQARRAMQGATPGTSLALFRPTGEQVLNTLENFGRPLPHHSNPENFRRIFETRQPQVSDLFIGEISGRPMLRVAIPVTLEEKVAYVMSINIPPEDFQKILDAQNLPSGWVGTILDSATTIVARSRESKKYEGQKPAPLFLDLRGDRDEGSLEFSMKDGVSVISYFTRTPINRWTVAMNVPWDSLTAQLTERLLNLALVITSLFAVGLSVAWVMGGRIARSVRALQIPAIALRSNQPAITPEIHFQEASEVARTMEITARLLEARTAALREAEHRFRQVFDHAVTGIAITDLSGNFEQCNPAYVALLQYSEEELHGMQSPNIVHPDDLQANMIQIRQLVEGKIIQFETENRYVRKDGQSIWAHNYVSLLPDNMGKAAYIMALVSDIDARKQMEASLKAAKEAADASEQRVSLAAEATGVGIWEWNVLTNAIRWDTEMFRIYGIPPTPDGYVQYSDWSDAVLPEDIEQQERVLQDTARRLGRSKREFRIKRRLDGECRHIEAVEVALADGEGKAEWVVGTNLDITERKQDELVLRNAMEVAERANNSKSRFLAAASHDLRQPLSALSIYVNALKSHVGPDGSPMLANMRDCVASLSELLTDLLDLSKLEAGVVIPNIRDFALDEIMAPVLAANEPEASVKGLQLRNHINHRFVRTDPLLAKRILGNLVANAVKYTDQGGVLVGCRRHAGKNWLEVWDTGMGIPQDKTSEIFEEFKQLGDEARTRGSGLGLAIVARMATLLGIEVRVHSRTGRGSVFAVELPPGQSPIEESVPLSQTPNIRSIHFAVVEDNPQVRVALALGLQSHGHRVSAAGSTTELLDLLKDDVPDVVVSDYRLQKGETGFDVIKILHEMHGDWLPAFIVTGDTDPLLVRSMADRGITVLHKPIDLEDLLAYAEDAISQTTVWLGLKALKVEI